ncbi:acyl carrier protein [Lysinibacillus sp. JNUCC 51]|uniref:acyl carrier protein n=1 Tax=Lysinibacillus sp. JNUCC-51 TaxID=2792479 RepID=UPI0019355A7B|nr:acyl carrier protein [Lysinibacillus sp. JNUCC-51]
MKDQIKTKFIEVYKMNISNKEIEDNVDLFGPESPYGLDSMDVLVFINEIKKEFNLEYNHINTDCFKTVNNIVEFINSQKSNQVI